MEVNQKNWVTKTTVSKITGKCGKCKQAIYITVVIMTNWSTD